MRKTLTEHSHRLNVIEATIASLKTDVGVLLSSVPVMNERLDNLEARVAALEARSQAHTASSCRTPSLSMSAPAPRRTISPRSITRYWSASDLAKS